MKIFKNIFFLMALFISHQAQAKLEVFACEPEWSALAHEIGGDEVNIFTATTGLQDPHHIEARPSLIAKMRRADLLICTGAELETGWLPVLLSKSGNNKIQPGKPGYFMATDFVELLGKPAKVDRSEGDVHATGNPHIHTSPHNISKVADALTQRLQQLDNSHQSLYMQRHDDFIKRWSAAITRWEQQAAPIKHHAFVVDHKSWIYLANWLQLDMSLTLEPKPGVPPSSEFLSELVNTSKQKQARKIIYAAYANPRAAIWLSEKTYIPATKLPFTVGGSSRATDLFSLFDETIQVLVN